MFDVRNRQADDMDGCVRALASVHEIGGYPLNWPDDPARWLTPTGMLEAWVCAIEESITGHVLVRQPSFATIGQDAAELSRLFVSPAAQRRGIAQALVATTMRWAAANHLNLVLEVTEHLHAARVLYERTGFRLVDTRRAGWTAPDGEPVTLHEYIWNPAG